MAKEIYLNGMTADQLSKMIRESLRDELQQFRPAHPKTDTKYLTRRRFSSRAIPASFHATHSSPEKKPLNSPAAKERNSAPDPAPSESAKHTV